MTRTPILKLPFAIDESCAINVNFDYPIFSTKHRLNYALVLNLEAELPPRADCAIETISPNFGVVCEKVRHSRRILNLISNEILYRVSWFVERDLQQIGGDLMMRNSINYYINLTILRWKDVVTLRG